MRKKKVLFRIFKRVKLRTLFFLAILMASNTFSWFIYTTKVSNSMTAHVKSWKVDFEIAGGDYEEEVFFKVDSVYPGMTPVSNEIVATNNGEAPADMSFEIVEASIMGEDLFADGSTSDDIITKLNDFYPFKIVISVDNKTLAPLGGTGKFMITLTWDYESGSDELDTYWGQKAYDFGLDNPDVASISLKVKVFANQITNE